MMYVCLLAPSLCAPLYSASICKHFNHTASLTLPPSFPPSLPPSSRAIEIHPVHSKIHQLSVAPLIAEAILNIHDCGSVSSVVAGREGGRESVKAGGRAGAKTR